MGLTRSGGAEQRSFRVYARLYPDPDVPSELIRAALLSYEVEMIGDSHETIAGAPSVFTLSRASMAGLAENVKQRMFQYCNAKTA